MGAGGMGEERATALSSPFAFPVRLAQRRNFLLVTGHLATNKVASNKSTRSQLTPPSNNSVIKFE